jgi:two-component system LytT family response regulator
MIRCLAIDDEPLALQQLVNFIDKIPYLQLVKACPSATEAKEVLSQDMVDAVFCDINMPDLNGMDFIKGLSFPPLVVFTTAYSEYAVEGFKVDAVDYLLKPFGLDDFRRAAEKLRRRIGEKEQETATSALKQPSSNCQEKGSTSDAESSLPKIGSNTDSLFVKVEGRMVKIRLSDIIYIEGMSEYLKIHLDGKDDHGLPRRPVVSLYSLKRLEERLPDYFMRIHRSYIINLRRIQEVSKTRVMLDNDMLLPIGDLYKDKLNDYLCRNYIGKH